jgi:transketolase
LKYITYIFQAYIKIIKLYKKGENMDINNKKATRQSYGEALLELGKENENIVVLDSDLASATKTDLFAKEFPNRFFDMGIAEQNMISTAAGMSTCGKIPYASTFAVFAAGRAYDQIRNSVCYPHLNVKICATHAGITVGEDGATHQMIEDISLMRTLPNMTVISTSDDIQTKWAVKEISKINGPVYLRLSRLATPIIYDGNQKFEIGKATQIGEGIDGTIFATGVTVSEAIKAQEELKNKGINVRVIDIHTIKPIDKDMIIKCAKETKKLVSIEDHNIIGGLGSAISEVLTDEYPTKLIRLGIKDTFGKSGKAEQLMKYFGIVAENIIELF